MVAVGIIAVDALQSKESLPNIFVESEFEDIRPLEPKREIIRGNPDARVFIVEYGDLQCPYCRKTHPILKKYIQSARGVNGDVAWIFRSAPYIDSVSDQKAETLACISLHYSNDITWKFLDESLLVAQEEAYPFDRYAAIFNTVGIDLETIEQCRKKGEANGIFQQGKRDAEVLDISLTPVIHFVTDENAILHETRGLQSEIDFNVIIETIFDTL